MSVSGDSDLYHSHKSQLLHRIKQRIKQFQTVLIVCISKYISQLIPLSELTAEYQCVAHYVKTDGLLDKTIVSIRRIQNLDLWEIFCR